MMTVMISSMFEEPQLNVCYSQFYEIINDIYLPLLVTYVSTYVFMRYYAGMG